MNSNFQPPADYISREAAIVRDASPASSLESVTVLLDVASRLSAITDAQIEAAGRTLKKPPADAKRIAIISDRTVRALFALRVILMAESDLEAAKARLATEEIIQDDHKRNRIIAKELADVSYCLLWAQIRTVTGFWKKANIVLCEGWSFCEYESGPNRLMEMLTGGGEE